MHQFKISPLVSSLAVVLTAAASVATASAAELNINGSACGTYGQATFTGAGALALTSVIGCDSGPGVPPGEDETYRFDADGYDRLGFDKDGYNKAGYDKTGYDKDGYDKDGYDKDGYDKDGYDKDGYDKDNNHRDDVGAGNGVPSYCKNPNAKINYEINGYTSIPRQTASIKGLETYIAKMVSGKGLGYGVASNAETSGSINQRVMSISECPGDFTEHLPKTGTCIREGQNSTLQWSYSATAPTGRGVCRLEEGKTYYFNVRNASISDLNKTTCPSGVCGSYFVSNGAPIK